jgi:hypothetical protein
VVVTSYTRIHKLEICLSIRDDYIDESGHWCVCGCVCVCVCVCCIPKKIQALGPRLYDLCGLTEPTTVGPPLAHNPLFFVSI